MPRARIDPETGLTEKQERFSLAYMENGGNATQAYLSSYNAKKAKPETVNNKAMVLLHKGEIGARIAALRNAAAKRAEVREADVLCETGHIAFSDLRKLFNENGTVKQPSPRSRSLRSIRAEARIGSSSGIRKGSGCGIKTRPSKN